VLLTVLLLIGLAPFMDRPRGSAATEATPPALSIALLPLRGASTDGDDGWLRDALGHDLTMELGRLSGTFVISRDTAAIYRDKAIDPRVVARELGVRYVVLGTVRREAELIHLALEMVDGTSGAQRWAESFVLDRARLPGSLADVARPIARRLSVQMYQSSGEAAMRLDPERVQADDLAMQGFAFVFRGLTPQNLREAAQRFDAAVAQDPNSLRGWSGVATVAGAAGALNWIPRDAAITRLEEAERRLLALDQDDYYTGMARSFIAFLKEDWDAHLLVNTSLAERFPSHPAPQYGRALALAAQGRFEECLVHAKRAIQLGPRDYAVGVYQFVVATCEFMLGRYQDAAAFARAAQQSNPQLPSPPVLLAASLARTGAVDEAREAIAAYRARYPQYEAAHIGRFLRGRDPRFIEGRDRVVATLRELGLP
jgi:adenylate cyclase